MKDLTPEQISKFQKLGFKISIVEIAECGLCGKKFEGKDVEQRRNTHIKNECKVSRFLDKFKPETTGAEVIRYVELVDKLQHGKLPTEKELDELLELSEKIRK